MPQSWRRERGTKLQGCKSLSLQGLSTGISSVDDDHIFIVTFHCHFSLSLSGRELWALRQCYGECLTEMSLSSLLTLTRPLRTQELEICSTRPSSSSFIRCRNLKQSCNVSCGSGCGDCCGCGIGCGWSCGCSCGNGSGWVEVVVCCSGSGSCGSDSGSTSKWTMVLSARFSGTTTTTVVWQFDQTHEWSQLARCPPRWSAFNGTTLLSNTITTTTGTTTSTRCTCNGLVVVVSAVVVVPAAYQGGRLSMALSLGLVRLVTLLVAFKHHINGSFMLQNHSV